MTREEKIDAILQLDVYDGETWASEKDFLSYVADILKEGFRGYNNMTDKEIDELYSSILMGE